MNCRSQTLGKSRSFPKVALLALFTASFGLGEARATDYGVQGIATVAAGTTYAVRGHLSCHGGLGTLPFAICAGPNGCCCQEDNALCCHRDVPDEANDHQSCCSTGDLCDSGGADCTNAIESVNLVRNGNCADVVLALCTSTANCSAPSGFYSSATEICSSLSPAEQAELHDENLDLCVVVDDGQGGSATIIADISSPAGKRPSSGIPTASSWGLAVMAFLLVAAGSLLLRRSRMQPPTHAD